MESGPVLSGKGLLETVVWEAGEVWLKSLVGIYDRLLYYVGDDPTFGDFVREIKGRWQKRVAEERWPRFTVS